MKRPMHIYFVKSFFSTPFTTPLGVLLLFFPAFVFSNNCIRSVSYEVLVEESFHLPSGTNVEALSLLDLLRGKNYTQRQSVEICIDQNQQMTITTTYQPDASGSFRKNPVWKSVVNAQGVQLFGFDGNPLPFDDLPFDDLATTFVPLNASNLDQFGYLPAFPDLDNEAIQALNDEEVIAFMEGQKLILLKENEEIIANPQAAYTVHKFYDGQLLLSSLTKEFQNLNDDRMLPWRNIEKNYRTLTTGERLQAKKVTTYLNYQIREDERILLDYNYPQQEQWVPENPQNRKTDQDQRNFGTYLPDSRILSELQVQPNPTAGPLQVFLPGLPWEQVSRLYLLDSAGNRIREWIVPEGASHVDLQVDDLPSGLYLLHYLKGNRSFSQRFVKH